MVCAACRCACGLCQYGSGLAIHIAQRRAAHGVGAHTPTPHTRGRAWLSLAFRRDGRRRPRRRKLKGVVWFEFLLRFYLHWGPCQNVIPLCARKQMQTCLLSNKPLSPKFPFTNTLVGPRAASGPASPTGATARGGGARAIARQGGAPAVELLGGLARLEHLVGRIWVECR